ncbi:hypothetical protein APUTEX25_003890, partial [Auxenochlorella protothecoides]
PNVEAISRLQDEIAGCSSASSLFRLLKRSQARLLVTGLVPLAWQAAAERGLLRPSPSTCKAQTRHQLLTLLVELGMRVATSLDAPALARLAAAAGAVQGGGTQVGPLLAALRRRAAQLPPAAFDPCAAIDTLCVLGCDGPQAGALLSHALDRCLPGLHAMQAAALAKLLVLLIKVWEDGSVGLVLATLDARIDQLDALDALCTLRCLAAWPDLSPSLISRLACHIGTRCIGLCAPDLCTLAGALLHLRHVPDETLRDGLVEAARRQVRATPPPQLARLAEAYCRLLGGFPRHRGLLQALQRRVVHSAQEWSGEDLSRLLACFARWGYDARPGPFVAALGRLARRTPGGAPAPELLDLLQLLADSVRADDLARLDPVGAAAALAACAHLPRHPGRLVETLKSNLLRHLQSFPHDQLDNAAQALACLSPEDAASRAALEARLHQLKLG